MMKRLIAAAFVVVVAASGVQASASVETVIAAYLEIQSALANDSIEGVPPAARRIGEAAGKMGASGAPIVKAAGMVADAKDIKAARDAFGPLSEAVITAVKADPAAHDVKLAYCPMAKASWLQKEEKIRNPYYGSSMLSCGEFRPLSK
jgi:hypothetical protein